MDSYDITRQFAVTLLELMRRTENKLTLARVTLGGVSGSGGGSGNPPGGYNGQLAQRYVTYDTTEAAVSGSVGGSGSIPSLVDNLNRIRANVFVFNDSTLPANIASSAAYGIRAYGSRDDHVHTVPLGANMSWVSGSLTSSGASGSGTVGGTGTINYLSKFTAASTIGNSNITDDGSTVSFLSPATAINIGATNAVVTGAGGLTLYGGSAANQSLKLGGTSHATRATAYILLWGADSSTTGKVGVATAAPKATFSVGGTGNPGFATQLTQQLYTDGNFDDHAIIGVNNFWSGAAFGPEDFSDAGVRLDMMGAAANSRQRFSFTISDITQVDTTILTGAIASDTSYGILNANSRLYVGAGNATTGVPLATAAIKGNLAVGNAYANATAPTNGIAVEGVVNIGATSNQLVLQAGGVTGTLTWTPSSTNKVIAYPNVSGSIALGAGTITNATTNDFYSGSHTHAISGTFPSALTATYIGFGSATNLLTGSASLIYNDTTKYLNLNGGVNDTVIDVTADDTRESIFRLDSVSWIWDLWRGTDGTFNITSGGVGNPTLTMDYAAGALSTTVAPTFPSIKLSNTSNQIVMQSAGVTGTLTWTPASTNKTITLPNLTGTVALGAGTSTVSSTNDITSGSHTHEVAGAAWLASSNVFTALQSVTAPYDMNNGLVRLQSTGADNVGMSWWCRATGANANSRNWQISANYNAFGDLCILRSTTNSGSPTTQAAQFLNTGDLSLSSTTDSSSATTGAITSAGGLGVAKTIHAGSYILSNSFIGSLVDGSLGGFLGGTANDTLLYRDTGPTWRMNVGLRVDGEVRVGGDVGGAASTNTLTGASNVAANSTGVGTIKFKGATSRDSTGFIKIYIGTTAYYVPVFSAITG